MQAMRADAEQYFGSTRGKLAILVGAFLAPLMFLTHELVTYIFVPWACSAAGKLPIYLMTAFSLVVAALGAWTAYRIWRDAGGTFSARVELLQWELGGVIGRTRFAGFVGFLFSLLFFMAILATAIPNWIMNACHP
jgi:hypothetical protein